MFRHDGNDMDLEQVVIIGAGGFAREVLDVFDAINAVKASFVVQGFIVDSQYGRPGTYVNGKPILGGFDWLAKNAPDVKAICGVGASEHRFGLVKRAEEAGVCFCNAIHPRAVLTNWINIGCGTVVTAGCTLTNQIRLGSHVHLNLNCTIGHDAVVEDFVTLAPGVNVSGRVVLRQGCYVGTGANIIEDREIGAWSIVGAGTTIVKDVPGNVTVVGSPGKVIKTRLEGWHLARSNH